MSRSARPLLAIAALLCLLGASALTSCGSDSDRADGSIEVTDAVVSVPPNPSQAAIYFTIENSSDTDDALLKAASPAAGKAELHHSMTEGGMASMDEQAKVDLPAGETVTFEAGGLHVMLTDLEEPLEVGGTLDLTLSFAQAGDHTISVKVVDGVAAASEGMEDMDYEVDGGAHEEGHADDS